MSSSTTSSDDCANSAIKVTLDPPRRHLKGTFDPASTKKVMRADGEVRLPSLSKFEHREGSLYCCDLFEHYVLPNGEVCHFYLEEGNVRDKAVEVSAFLILFIIQFIHKFCFFGCF